MLRRLAKLAAISSLIILGLSPGSLVFAQTTVDLQALIVQLQAQIKALEARVKAISAELTASREEVRTLAAEVQFTRSLQRGASGEEVSKLQEFLKQFPDVYPEGLITGFFGPLTEQAVKRWQERQGFEAVGAVGPRTRAKLNELLTEGAGASGLIPPGLLTAPGLHRESATGTLPALPLPVPPPAAGATTTAPAPPTVASSPSSSATTTQTCGKIIAVPSEQYPTLSSAIAQACSGDLVKIAAGSYFGGFTLTPRHTNITITGVGLDETVLQGTSSPVLFIEGAKNIAIKNLTIERGGSRGRDGGGIAIARSEQISLENCRMRLNTGRHGGALSLQDSSLTVTRCLFDRNVASGSGGAIAVRGTSKATLTHVTVASNSSGCHGGGVAVDPTAALALKNAIIWGNASGQTVGVICPWSPSLSGTSAVSYSDVQFGATGLGNVDRDPLFRSVVVDDYRLVSPSSPAYNSGDPFTFDPDGTRADMGVFPYGAEALALAPAPLPAPIPTPTPPPPSATSTAPALTPTPLAPPPPPPPPTSALPSGVTWVRLIGGSGYEFGRAVALDGSGNAYLVGYTQSSALDGQPYAGGQDGFLAKYDPSGTKLWTRLVGNAGSDDFETVAADSGGNVYAGGATYSGSIDGQPAGALLVKFDANGSKLWTRTIGTAGNRVIALAADQSGNVYAAGTASGPIDGQGYAGGPTDIFLAKYSSGGTRLWTRLRGSAATDIPEAVVVDASGNVFVAGWVGGAVGFESFAGGSYDAFVAKYDSGSLNLWQRLVGSSRNEYAQGVGVDASGNVYITGYAEAGFDGQTISGGVVGSNYDAFVTKFDTRGTKAWTRFFGGTASEYVMHGAADSGGNVYIGGYVDGALDGISIAGGGFDAFVIKVDPNGTKLWSRLLGSGGSDEGFGVAVDSSGNPYLAGRTAGSLGQANSGGMDGFIAKFSGTAAVSPPPPPAPAPVPAPAPPPATATTTLATPLPPSSADTTPPVISNIQVTNIAQISAIVSWTTSEPSDGKVSIFKPGISVPGETSWAALVTAHTFNFGVFSLSAGTTYSFTVSSTDAAGNTAASALQSFTTAAATTSPTTTTADTTPPVISNIAVAFSTIISGQTVATITWTTDEAADTELAYGLNSLTNPSGGGITHLYAWVTTHSVQTDGLQPGGAYVYQVKSTDAAGNTAASAHQSFPAPTTMPGAPFMLSPIGGEQLTLSSASALKWRSPAVGYQASLFLVDAATQSKTWRLFDTSAGYVGENTIPWVVGGYDHAWGYVVAGQYYARVCQRLDGPQYVNCDLSDGPFSIVDAPTPPPPPPPAATPPDLLVYRTSVGRVANPSLSGQSLNFSYELRGTTPFISNSYILGEVLNFSYEVQNSGGAAVSGVVPGIAVGQAPGGDDIRSGATTDPAIQNFTNGCPANLAAGSSCTIGFNLAYQTGGTKYVYARLDPLNQIAEGVETNNDAIVSFILNLSAPSTATTTAAAGTTIASVLDALRTLLGEIGRLLERSR